MRYIGTAGWAIPSRYQRMLPGNGSHLERYARRLNAVEINSSFYRHHRARTYARWASGVPEDFRFSLKVPRALTHRGRLSADAAVLDRFIEEVGELGTKLGVLLVQLPPSLPFDEPVARGFFGELRKRIDAPIACEPHHPSWGSEPVDRVLADCAIARVAADPAPWLGAGSPGGYRELAYFRWHGQPRMYYSDYDEAHLAAARQHLKSASEHATDVWFIFDNTALGHALGNALAIAPDQLLWYTQNLGPRSASSLLNSSR